LFQEETKIVQHPSKHPKEYLHHPAEDDDHKRGLSNPTSANDMSLADRRQIKYICNLNDVGQNELEDALASKDLPEEKKRVLLSFSSANP